MQNRKYWMAGLLGVLVVLIGWGIYNSAQENKSDAVQNDALPEESALDVTIDFYQSWLEASVNATATPSVADLLGSAIVSEGLRTYITAAEANGVISPVLCQTTGVVERIRVASVLDTERVAQLQIFARGEGLTTGEYALVELAVTDGTWVIETIGCYSGESAPEQEFPFTQRGQLLKSVPPPLDSNVWHLVFVENELPQVVPLGFATDSVCVAADGAEATCDQSQFVEAATVTAKGSMSESGPTVERLEFAQ